MKAVVEMEVVGASLPFAIAVFLVVEGGGLHSSPVINLEDLGVEFPDSFLNRLLISLLYFVSVNHPCKLTSY